LSKHSRRSIRSRSAASREAAATTHRSCRDQSGGSGPDSRDSRPIAKPRDMYQPNLLIDTLKLKARNFRWPNLNLSYRLR
jgi:hypothetical protein